jgi:hypothetical protein
MKFFDKLNKWKKDAGEAKTVSITLILAILQFLYALYQAMQKTPDPKKDSDNPYVPGLPPGVSPEPMPEPPTRRHRLKDLIERLKG